MKNYILLLFIFGLLWTIPTVMASSITTYSKDMPNTESWMEWIITKSTDGYDVQIENSRSKITTFILMDPNAKNQLSLSSKNVYDETGKILTTLTPITKVTASSIQYGYIYTTTKDMTYVKFGENTTIITWVNQTGGGAQKGYSFFSDRTHTSLAGAPMPIFSSYSTAEKAVVSTDNSTVVVGTGTTLGGVDCTDNTLGSCNADAQSCPCSGLTFAGQTICEGSYFYTSTSATPCIWVSGSCTSQAPCNDFSFHEFTFKVSPTGIYNMTFVGKTTSSIAGNPVSTYTAFYLFRNYTNTVPTSSTYWINVGSCTATLGQVCNFSFSTNNQNQINSFINQSNGIAQVTVLTNNLNLINMRYVELKLDYKDLFINFNTFVNYLYPNLFNSNQNNLNINFLVNEK